MMALQMVGKVITVALTTEQARELYIFMKPSRSSPTIAPTLQHLHDFSNSILPQRPKQVLKRDRASEIKGEGLQQFSVPSLLHFLANADRDNCLNDCLRSGPFEPGVLAPAHQLPPNP